MNTLPILLASCTACATPGAEDVHSPTRPVRSGWAFIRSVAIWVALAWSSPAYTVSTICACGYLVAVYSFWTLIQEFRFSAVWPQETIAYLPWPPMGLSSASVSDSPMPCAVAWLTNASRTELGASVSAVATWMPCALASCSRGAIESGSFGATISVLTFCWMNERTMSACAAASAWVGPW